jgi:dihydroorotate dehydrogenase electron transfer subunit
MVHYADQALSIAAEVVSHQIIAEQTMRLRLSVPPAMAAAVPGQFFMLRDQRSSDPLIGRAFAMYDSHPAEGWIDLVYVIKGKLTRSICDLKTGNRIAIWGPLGNSFDDSPTQHLVIVAGGIGQTPFLSLIKEATGRQRYAARRAGYAGRVTMCYGARSARYLAEVSAFEEAGATVRLATEDGSVGPAVRVTEVLAKLLEAESDLSDTRIVCCGPEPMMQAVSEIADQYRLPCQVSLETPMACGIGICFTCVARVGTSQDWDYQRTCVEGPIFAASEIVW